MLPGVTVHDPGVVRCGIVGFTVAGYEPIEIKRVLAQSRINVTVSQQSSSRLDMEARGLTSVVRASVHYYNSEDEVERFCATLAALLGAV
jgi:selenocysteine lyase/cysteine desulfurase